MRYIVDNLVRFLRALFDALLRTLRLMRFPLFFALRVLVSYTLLGCFGLLSLYYCV